MGRPMLFELLTFIETCTLIGILLEINWIHDQPLKLDLQSIGIGTILDHIDSLFCSSNTMYTMIPIWNLEFGLTTH